MIGDGKEATPPPPGVVRKIDRTSSEQIPPRSNQRLFTAVVDLGVEVFSKCVDEVVVHHVCREAHMVALWVVEMQGKPKEPDGFFKELCVLGLACVCFDTTDDRVFVLRDTPNAQHRTCVSLLARKNVKRLLLCLIELLVVLEEDSLYRDLFAQGLHTSDGPAFPISAQLIV